MHTVYVWYIYAYAYAVYGENTLKNCERNALQL